MRYHGNDTVNKIVLRNQQYVRAELTNFDFDYYITIQKFTVLIVSDSSRSRDMINMGHEINEEIRNAFQRLKENDIIIFKDIYATAQEWIWPVTPIMLTVVR